MTEAERKVQRDLELMQKLKVGVSAMGPSHEDEEYSKGEFLTDVDEYKYRESKVAADIKKGMRQRKKRAEKEERRHGGKIVLWTFDEMKKGKRLMSAKEREEEMDEEMNDEENDENDEEGEEEDTDEETNEEEDEDEEEEKPKKKKAVKSSSKEKDEKSSKKPKKEVKKPKEKKDMKPAHGKKKKEGRGARIVDGKITLIEKENPKRKNSKAYKRYELYRKHKDVAAYIEAGGKRSSLRYDSKHGFIKLSGVTTTKKD